MGLSAPSQRPQQRHQATAAGAPGLAWPTGRFGWGTARARARAARYAGDHRRGGARPDTRLGAFDAGLLRGPTRGGAAGPRSPETTWSSMAHGGSSAPVVESVGTCGQKLYTPAGLNLSESRVRGYGRLGDAF